MVFQEEEGVSSPVCWKTCGKDKEKGVIYRLERLYEQAKDIASGTGEAISEVYERLKEAAGFNEGGMPTQRKGNLDYRNSTVTNRVDNRKNK